MTITEIREEIINCYNFSMENNMIDPVIKLYIDGEEDIEIWDDNHYFYFSTGSFRYGEINDLLDDLCKQIEDNGWMVTDIDIE